jgi:hypothetical protein
MEATSAQGTTPAKCRLQGKSNLFFFFLGVYCEYDRSEKLEHFKSTLTFKSR